MAEEVVACHCWLGPGTTQPGTMYRAWVTTPARPRQDTIRLTWPTKEEVVAPAAARGGGGGGSA